MERRGTFLVLDGIDGCGKSTQARLLVKAMEERWAGGVLHLREPGSTAVGEVLRELLLSREHELGAGVETLLFTAARRQMLEQVVEPALAAGRAVVCERFHPSTFAYQAVAGGLEPEAVLRLLADWTGEPSPDLVLVLDLPVARAGSRRGAPTDRIEDKGLEFQERVAEGYRQYAERVPGVSLLDADGEPEDVASLVLAEVSRVL
jgi:dTMP kinase